MACRMMNLMTGAFAKLPDGHLAFGGVNGVNVFDPAEVLVRGYHLVFL
jgi:hypothetical protein